MTPGTLPKQLEDTIARLPRNRHGRRAAGAILRKFARGLNIARRDVKVRDANRREARKTPSMRRHRRYFDEYLALSAELG